MLGPSFCFSLSYLGQATPICFGLGGLALGVTQSRHVSIPSVTNLTQVRVKGGSTSWLLFPPAALQVVPRQRLRPFTFLDEAAFYLAYNVLYLQPAQENEGSPDPRGSGGDPRKPSQATYKSDHHRRHFLLGGWT